MRSAAIPTSAFVVGLLVGAAAKAAVDYFRCGRGGKAGAVAATAAPGPQGRVDVPCPSSGAAPKLPPSGAAGAMSGAGSVAVAGVGTRSGAAAPMGALPVAASASASAEAAPVAASPELVAAGAVFLPLANAEDHAVALMVLRECLQRVSKRLVVFVDAAREAEPCSSSGGSSGSSGSSSSVGAAVADVRWALLRTYDDVFGLQLELGPTGGANVDVVLLPGALASPDVAAMGLQAPSSALLGAEVEVLFGTGRREEALVCARASNSRVQRRGRPLRLAVLPPACLAVPYPSHALFESPLCRHGGGSFAGVVLGGTFDRLHVGHKKLLTCAAAVCNGRLVIGVTVEAMLRKKAGADRIAGFKERADSVVAFLASVKPAVRVEIVPLEDRYGPAVTDGSLQVRPGACEGLCESGCANGRVADRQAAGWKVVGPRPATSPTPTPRTHRTRSPPRPGTHDPPPTHTHTSHPGHCCVYGNLQRGGHHQWHSAWKGHGAAGCGGHPAGQHRRGQQHVSPVSLVVRGVATAPLRLRCVRVTPRRLETEWRLVALWSPLGLERVGAPGGWAGHGPPVQMKGGRARWRQRKLTSETNPALVRIATSLPSGTVTRKGKRARGEARTSRGGGGRNVHGVAPVVPRSSLQAVQRPSRQQHPDFVPVRGVRQRHDGVRKQAESHHKASAASHAGNAQEKRTEQNQESFKCVGRRQPAPHCSTHTHQ
jgi:hypothetical protein